MTEVYALAREPTLTFCAYACIDRYSLFVAELYIHYEYTADMTANISWDVWVSERDSGCGSMCQSVHA